MGEANVTIFGDVAEDYDTLVDQNQKYLDRWVEEHNYSTGSMVWASTLIAFMRVSQSMVDTLKLGNGVASGTLKGVAVDGLRLLNLTGVGGAAFSRLTRVLVVAQKGGNLCSWISTVNAIRRSGQRFFISLADLAQEAGVDLRVINALGTDAAAFAKLEQALAKLGIPFIAIRTGRMITSIETVLRQNPNSVLVFGVKYAVQVEKAAGQVVEEIYAHRMLATFSKSAGLIIKDTTGTVYRSLAAMLKAYPKAVMSDLPPLVIPNAAVLGVAGDLQNAGSIASIMLAVMPMEFKKPDVPERPYMRNKPWEY